MKKPFNPRADRYVPPQAHEGEHALETARRKWEEMGGERTRETHLGTGRGQQVIPISGHTHLWSFDTTVKRYLGEGSYGKLYKWIVKMIRIKGRVAVKRIIDHSAYRYDIMQYVSDLF